MRPLKIIKALVLSLLLPKSTCFGQEQPTLSLNYFNYSTSYRQSVCERQAQIDNGTLQLRDALAGLEVSTWLVQDDRYVRFDERKNAIDPDDPGLIGVLMDELANRAGFTWRNSFGALGNLTLPEGKTYTDLLVWSVSTYDVSAAYWAKSLRRMDLGASFPEGWYDGRIIMIGVEEPEGSASLDIWSFLEPFTTGVWVMILVTIVVSAFVYMFLDWYDTDSDERVLGNAPGQNIFLTAITFTGHFEFKPTSNSARIMTASLAFWSLIVMSAYTANLASFLVVQNTPSIEINTLGDAVKNDFLICVTKNTNAEETVRKAYPGARLVSIEGEAEVYQGLRAGMCDIALNSVSSWLEYRGDRSVNGDCRLTWLGRNLQSGEGGFATKSDSGTLCTSLIRDVLNLHLLEMKDNGFVERAWEDHLRKRATVDCDTTSLTEEDGDESEGQLSLHAMGGTFIIHYIATGCAIFLAVAMKCWRSKQRWKCGSLTARMGASNGKRIESAKEAPTFENNAHGGPEQSNLETAVSLPNTYEHHCSTDSLQGILREQSDRLAALEKQNSELLSVLRSGNFVASLDSMDTTTKD